MQQISIQTFKSSCFGMMVILFPSILSTVPFKFARSPSATSTTSPVTKVCLSSSDPSLKLFVGTENKNQNEIFLVLLIYTLARHSHYSEKSQLAITRTS